MSSSTVMVHFISGQVVVTLTAYNRAIRRYNFSKNRWFESSCPKVTFLIILNEYVLYFFSVTQYIEYILKNSCLFGVTSIMQHIYDHNNYTLYFTYPHFIWIKYVYLPVFFHSKIKKYLYMSTLHLLMRVLIVYPRPWCMSVIKA